jgi:hypothetical protein
MFNRFAANRSTNIFKDSLHYSVKSSHCFLNLNWKPLEKMRYIHIQPVLYNHRHPWPMLKCHHLSLFYCPSQQHLILGSQWHFPFDKNGPQIFKTHVAAMTHSLGVYLSLENKSAQNFKLLKVNDFTSSLIQVCLQCCFCHKTSRRHGQARNQQLQSQQRTQTLCIS